MSCTSFRRGMDRILFVIAMLLPHIYGLTITASRNPTGTLVIGNMFTLTSVIDSQGAVVFSTNLARKRESDIGYETIVSFPGPTSDRNVTYIDTSLEFRTTAVKPTSSSMTVSLTFQYTVCADKASYRWTVNYYDVMQEFATATTHIDSLKALSTFRNDGQVSYLPSSRLQEGDEVVFSCQGNVGNTPIGSLAWYMYTHGMISGGSLQIQSVTTNPPTVDAGNPCSYRRSSSLRLTMTSDMDGAVLRCTAQQDVKNEFGDNTDNYKQTGKLSVMYSPKNVVIAMRPAGNGSVYDEGTELLTLTCSADAKPEPSYYWIASAFSPTATNAGAVFRLPSLTFKDTGVYICVVQNSINGQNHSANASVSITVDRDECASRTAKCKQNCQNTQGSYTCSCGDGYTLNDDGVTCDDRDECASRTANCEQNCQNTQGSYTCSCGDGYTLNDDDGVTCDDVDECMLGTAGCAQDCRNTAGGFKCSCHDGFIGYDDGRTCDAAPPPTDGTSNAALIGVAVAGWTVAALLVVGIGLVVWRRRDSLFPESSEIKRNCRSESKTPSPMIWSKLPLPAVRHMHTRIRVWLHTIAYSGERKAQLTKTCNRQATRKLGIRT